MLHKTEITVSNLVEHVVREQSGRMAGHAIEVAIPETSLKVRGDLELLSMALVQFLDNAAKYSFAGEIVKVSARESHSEVTISVHNFGPAIPMSERERIFQRFYRSEGSKAMAEGTGVGLSTVKMAAEAHRGPRGLSATRKMERPFFLSLPQFGRRSRLRRKPVHCTHSRRRTFDSHFTANNSFGTRLRRCGGCTG